MSVAGVILGAGLGSRMGPLTDNLPKPLLPLAGVPLVSHVVERLAEAGVEEIFVNLHYHAERMRAHLAELEVPFRIRSRVEPSLTGPAGALRLFQEELADYQCVLVASADVIVGESLSGLVATHLDRPALLTFGCVRVTGARRYGVLDLDPVGDVIRAREKPDVPDDEPFWVSAGVYCLAPWAIDHVVPGTVQDYARDVAPALIHAGQRVGTHTFRGYWRDLGTPAALHAAEQDVAEGRIPWLTNDGH